MPKLPSNFLPKLAVLSYFSCWFAYFSWFWSKSISFDTDGNLMMGHVNMWGDWAAHFTMGSSLAFRDLFLTDSPFIVNARFSYPFISNFISAVLIRLGLPFFNAFITPSFIMSCVLVVALFYFFKTLFRSRKIAIIASLIFMLNGGLGFAYFVQDIFQSPQPLETFINPPHEYTRLDDQNIKWISIIDSMVIPQRAFNHGFPLALIALGLIYNVIYLKSKRGHLKLIGAGLLLGLMPMIHTHSFLAAGIILSFWLAGSILALPNRDRRHLQPLLIQWGIVGTVALVLALPLFLYFFYNQTQGFIQWYPGWLAKEFDLNWFVFWIKNWGLTPVLSLIGLVTVWQASRPEKRLVNLFTWLPFLLLFALANLFLFQPFSWDNTKLIVWSSIGISGLTAFGLAYLADHSREIRSIWVKVLGSLVATSLFVFSIASGAVDAYWIARTDLHSFQMYSAEELSLAEWVTATTPTNSIWLTGSNHNHWLFNLTGRQAVMTYPGWLWTHGYNYRQVESDVFDMYADPVSDTLFDKYGITHVVIGPAERRGFNPDEAGFDEHFEIEMKSKNVTIYKRN